MRFLAELAAAAAPGPAGRAGPWCSRRRGAEFGGCYLRGHAPGDPADAKFAKEFFKKVESSQGFVAWTDEAFAEDASYRSMARMGYAALGLIARGVGARGVCRLLAVQIVRAGSVSDGVISRR